MLTTLMASLVIAAVLTFAAFVVWLIYCTLIHKRDPQGAPATISATGRAFPLGRKGIKIRLPRQRTKRRDRDRDRTGV